MLNTVCSAKLIFNILNKFFCFNRIHKPVYFIMFFMWIHKTHLSNARLWLCLHLLLTWLMCDTITSCQPRQLSHVSQMHNLWSLGIGFSLWEDLWFHEYSSPQKFTIYKINKRGIFHKTNKNYIKYPGQKFKCVWFLLLCVASSSILYFKSVYHCKLISYWRCSVNYLAHIDLDDLKCTLHLIWTLLQSTLFTRVLKSRKCNL